MKIVQQSLKVLSICFDFLCVLIFESVSKAYYLKPLLVNNGVSQAGCSYQKVQMQVETDLSELNFLLIRFQHNF